MRRPIGVTPPKRHSPLLLRIVQSGGCLPMVRLNCVSKNCATGTHGPRKRVDHAIRDAFPEVARIESLTYLLRARVRAPRVIYNQTSPTITIAGALRGGGGAVAPYAFGHGYRVDWILSKALTHNHGFTCVRGYIKIGITLTLCLF